MRSRPRVWIAAAVVAAAWYAAAGCSEAFAPVTLAAPESLAVQARSIRSVLLEWMPVDDDDVIAYRVERRADFDGPYLTIADNVPQVRPGPVFLLDDQVEPETFYGYRVRVIDRFGGISDPSVVRGARTPPEPAIVLRTVSHLEAPTAADADGYAVVIRNGTDSVVGPVAPTGQRRFGPLPPGAYHVELRGLASNCVVDEGGPMRDAPVTDVGLETQTLVEYVISCADPGLGRITARVDVSGDNRDSNGVVVHLEGIHPTAPDSLRVTLDSSRMTGPNGGQRIWTGLRPGDFQVALAGLDPKCAVDGASRSVQVHPLSDDTVRFAVTCPDIVVDTTTRPGYQLRNTWGSVSGGTVTLTIAVDMGAFNDPAINGAGPDDLFAIQGSTRYDSVRLRFASAANVTGSGLQNLAVNGSTKGAVEWGNFSTLAAPQTGPQGVIVITFDVLGTGSVTTQTSLSVAESQAGDNLVPNMVLREGVLSLAGGGGGGGNTAPTARPAGPYSGVAGAAVAFSGSTSSDPDGTIASYAWSFGDGGTATGASPQHSYAAAGTYTVSLTVTDNGGATGTASTSAVIAPASGGGNQAPVASAGGPYFGTAGVAVVFNGGGSSDPDGTIGSWAWSFGDGGTGSGATAQHTYVTAGTYTATLTVTDNQGLTNSTTTSVNVAAAGGSTPFTWHYVVTGTPVRDSIITLTVLLDLTADIPQTPGAEELQSFAVDSLQWNPAVLQYFAFNHGPGGFGSVQPFAAQGRLAFQGTLGAANRSGIITIAVVRFKVLGSLGASVTTASTVGALTGTAATGSFSYRSRTQIVETTLTIQ